MIPVLFLTMNRLEYTKKSLNSLLHSDCGNIIIIDNCSTDGTQEYLNTLFSVRSRRATLIFNKENRGIAFAMNQFLELTANYEFAGKVDCDTIVPEDWCSILLKKMIALDIDLIQARHPIIPAVYYGKSFDEWTKTMKQDKADPSIYYNHFIGGTGMIFRRSCVDKIPETTGKLMGWREWQREHPEVKKAFCTEVSVDLLDAHGYNDYKEYYKLTGRLA